MAKAGRARKDPTAERWVEKDQEAADEVGLTLEEYRAEYLKGYDNATGEPIQKQSLDDLFGSIELPPVLTSEGLPNPDHYRAKIAYVGNAMFLCIAGKLDLPKNFNILAVKEILKEEARSVGLDPDSIGDTRSEADKAMDASKLLIDMPSELLAQTDDTITALEVAMNLADQHCAEWIGAPGTRKGDQIDRDALLYKIEQSKKKIAEWRNRLRRVRILRGRVRREVPEGKTGTRNHIAYSAASDLRWIIYMMRPGKPTVEDQFGVHVQSNPTRTYQVGLPHARMAVCDFMCQGGWIRTKRYVNNVDSVLGYERDNNGPMEGTIKVMAPGHGKSAYMYGKISKMIAQDPTQRWIFLHAQGPMASDNLQHVASFFDPMTAQGRRLLSFYPDLEVEQASTISFRLRLEERQRSPTILSCGTRAKKGGTDADFIWSDDYVDQAAAEQETERKRDFSRWNGTWVRRIRGQGFHFTTTTLWHHEDANALRISQVRKGTLRVGVCIMPCGGQNTNPQFFPVWPEQYPAKYLRATYNAMRDPRLYAAAYQCDPKPDEMRMVKALSYFLREVPEMIGPSQQWCQTQMDMHREFLKSAVYYISIDPSATKDEKNDHACFIYAAVGDLKIKRKTDTGATIESRHVARILDAKQMHMTQTELVHEVGEYSAVNKVDYIICETRSGFNAMSEIFYSTYGIHIISYDPKNRKKLLRLMDVAPMLDAKLMARGLAPPAIEFPGKVSRQDGGIVHLGPADEYVWLATQILDAGMCSEDHALDAVTQFARHIGPEMGCGVGAITQKIQALVPQTRSQQAAARMLDSYQTPKASPNVAQDDLDFSQSWSH